jgi:predicted ribonuclease YlaK
MDLGAVPGKQQEKLMVWSENYTDATKAIAKKLGEQHKPAPAVANNRVVEDENGGRPSHKRPELSRAERRAARETRQNQEQQASKTKNLANQVELVAFPHLRGRSIADAFLIMDEAQNSSIHEMKTYLTRTGEGSKQVILGDASQIDLPYLNENNNGLSVAVSINTGANLTVEEQSRVAYVRLTEGVRSALAEMQRRLFEEFEKHGLAN